MKNNINGNMLKKHFVGLSLDTSRCFGLWIKNKTFSSVRLILVFYFNMHASSSADFKISINKPPGMCFHFVQTLLQMI